MVFVFLTVRLTLIHYRWMRTYDVDPMDSYGLSTGGQ